MPVTVTGWLNVTLIGISVPGPYVPVAVVEKTPVTVGAVVAAAAVANT